ncbi:MAG: GGDEF domain-containing protein [Synergistaceae bacterium]|nr:GGDEF domain-containing protein [Synergistaceae bacterium]
MSLASAFSKIWHESAAAFAGSGYVIFTIEANVVCIIVLAILFNRQQNSSDQTETGLLWSKILFVQILYCLTWVFRVMADAEVFPGTNIAQYVITSINIGLLGYMCWMIFIYMEYAQNSGLLSSMRNRIIAALPFALNVIMLGVSLGRAFLRDIAGAEVHPGLLFPSVLPVTLVYPAASVVSSFLRRSKMSRYERETLPAVALYPAVLAACILLQALNWRMPFLCYVIIISDLIMHLLHADSLILVDPLTKIPNRNGLMRSLTERLGGEAPENIHVFAVDIEDMGMINSSYGRIEGDKVLVLTAEALKKFRDEEHPCYVARYYGDEFIITADIQDDEERDLFVEHIRNYVSNAAISHRLRYHLRVGVGWARYEHFSRTETISGLIEEADRSLTENREQRRFQHMWHGSRG